MLTVHRVSFFVLEMAYTAVFVSKAVASRGTAAQKKYRKSDDQDRTCLRGERVRGTAAQACSVLVI
jgi:hypothetical protein